MTIIETGAGEIHNITSHNRLVQDKLVMTDLMVDTEASSQISSSTSGGTDK